MCKGILHCLLFQKPMCNSFVLSYIHSNIKSWRRTMTQNRQNNNSSSFKIKLCRIVSSGNFIVGMWFPELWQSLVQIVNKTGDITQPCSICCYEFWFLLISMKILCSMGQKDERMKLCIYLFLDLIFCGLVNGVSLCWMLKRSIWKEPCGNYWACLNDCIYYQ